MLKLLVICVALSAIECKPVAQDDRIVFFDDDETYEDARKLNLDEILSSENLKSNAVDDVEVAENGNLFEGDIVLQPDQREVLLSNRTDAEFGTRTGVVLDSYKWRKNRNGEVVVPYAV